MEQPMMKMYCLLRNDIWMSPGKAAAQAGHAFVHTTFANLNEDDMGDRRLGDYHGRDNQPTMGTRIVLGVNIYELTRVHNTLCLDKFLPHYLVTDSGHIFPPDFDGTYRETALGIGPLYDEEQSFLAHLPLYTNRFWHHFGRRLMK